MSYVIIRNIKYKRENLKAIYRHNERKNKNYSNNDIDKTKSYLNYSLKEPEFNYEKQFDKISENDEGFAWIVKENRDEKTFCYNHSRKCRRV